MPGNYIRFGTKRLTTGSPTLDARKLKKDGHLTYPSDCISVSYDRQTQILEVDWTECNFGGFRSWFICPARNCYKRAAILYLSNIFACRSCCNLAYPSENAAHEWRYKHQSGKIREKLGWGNGVYVPFPKELYKPKGMHWKSYFKLINKYKEIENKAMAPMIARMRAEQKQAEALCQSWIEQGW